MDSGRGECGRNRERQKEGREQRDNKDMRLAG